MHSAFIQRYITTPAHLSQNWPFPWGPVHHLTQGLLGPHYSVPKWHLDWFSHFCTTHPCAQHTQTMLHAMHSKWPHLCTACGWCSKIQNRKAHCLGQSSKGMYLYNLKISSYPNFVITHYRMSRRKHLRQKRARSIQVFRQNTDLWQTDKTDIWP